MPLLVFAQDRVEDHIPYIEQNKCIAIFILGKRQSIERNLSTFPNKHQTRIPNSVVETKLQQQKKKKTSVQKKPRRHK